MHRFIAGSAAFCVALGVAFAQDAKKHELLYRWDQLDGKTAVYDSEVTTTIVIEAKGTTETTEHDQGSLDTPDSRTEAITTTKTRVLFGFKAGEGGRGLVTVTTERLATTVTQKTLGETETLAYDSQNPPKEGVPEKLKALVAAALGKPYTLTVSRRGVVEKVEGRPAGELPKLKGSFLVFPDNSVGEGESWNLVQRTPTNVVGDIVQRAKYKLAKVDEKEQRIDEEVETELDDKLSKLPSGSIARIEKPVGKGHLTFDARGLKQEEETQIGYELFVKQYGEGIERRTKFLVAQKWKLVEVKDAK